METVPQVDLEKYSGPMDLLLDLVKKEDIDICHIDICQITNSYLDYIRKAGPLNLEHTGNFIKLASSLLLIKSRILLPVLETEEEDASEESCLPENLKALLKEYQKYQTAGNLMYAKALLGRDTWAAGRVFSPEPTPLSKEDVLVDSEQASFLFVESYLKVLEKVKRIRPHIPLPPIPSLSERVREISCYLIKGAKKVFSHLVKLKKSEHSFLLTFLSLLELSKQGFVALFQKSIFSDIEVVTKKEIDFSRFHILDEEEQQLPLKS